MLFKGGKIQIAGSGQIDIMSHEWTNVKMARAMIPFKIISADGGTQKTGKILYIVGRIAKLDSAGENSPANGMAVL